IDGNVSMTFSLYNQASGGAALWKETQVVAVAKGYFSVKLGAQTALPPTVWSGGGSRYVGLGVGSDAEMSPREELVAVPYAFVSGDAVGDIHPTSISIGDMPIIDE